MRKQISIIIPVYNVEEYLSKCLDSILEQSFQEYEVILVDDGSTDKSGLICDEYTKIDNRITVIHKTNGGVTSARKTGFEASHGTFIANIDSDDWLDPNHLLYLYQAIIDNNADIAQSGYYINSIKEERKYDNKPKTETISDVIADCLEGKIHSGLWCKLINRKLYEKDDFLFPPCDFTDDLHTSISLLLNAKKYCYVPSATYHYRMNDNSLTHENTMNKRFRKYRESMTNLTDIYQRLKIKENPIYKESLMKRVNGMKRELIKSHPDSEELTSLLEYFPHSYNIGSIRSIGDLFFYMACSHKFLVPYKIKKYLR